MEVGLACAFSADPDTRQHVTRMAGKLVPVENSTLSSFDTPLLALRTRTVSWKAPAIAHDAETGTHLILLGRAWQSTQAVPASALLALYLRDGEAALTQLGGSFGILIWLPQSDTLLAVTDRLATKKMYLWHAGSTALLATELQSLLAHPLTPHTLDDVAVGQFLITSHLVDTRTLIQDVSVLPPATLTRISRTGITRERYWSPRIRPTEAGDLDAWADRLAEVLKPAVQSRCGTTPLILPLSGGLDARSVAAFLPPERAAASQACSFGHNHCYDVRFGRHIARALGAPFEQLAIPEDFFKRYLAPVQALCDGEVSIEALPMYRLMDVGQPGQTMLMGFLGDALSGGHLPQLAPDASRADILDTLWHKFYQGKGFSDALLERVLLPERYASLQGSTRALMRSAFDEADAATPEEKSLVVELHHRQSRYISYFGRMLSARFQVEMPFLDTDVMDAFLALPLAFRQNQRAYRRMLVRHAPALAAIPENKTGRPVSHADQHGLPVTRYTSSRPTRLPEGLQWRLNTLRRYWGQGLVALSGGWLGPHPRGDYVHHDENIRDLDPAWFRAQLLDDPYASEWFKRAELDRMLNEHCDHKQDHSSRINNIVAFLAWRKQAGV